MKLINYKRGYNNLFDCSIHGTIKMNVGEYLKVIDLMHKKNMFSTWTLSRDLERKIFTKKGFYVNVRTTATDLIAKKWKLTNYKRGNYQLFVYNI